MVLLAFTVGLLIGLFVPIMYVLLYIAFTYVNILMQSMYGDDV